MSDFTNDEFPKLPPQTINAVAPFTFGIGLQGEVVIGFVQQYLGIQGETYLVIPAAEVETLRRVLAQTQSIQETLSAKLPPQGAH